MSLMDLYKKRGEKDEPKNDVEESSRINSNGERKARSERRVSQSGGKTRTSDRVSDIANAIQLRIRIENLIDEFEQIRTYFRKGDRPSQKKAIEVFEKHLNEIINK